MSSFIVEDRVINRVLDWVDRYQLEHPGWGQEIVEAGYPRIGDDWYKALGQDMFKLNIQAVCKRYPDCDPSYFRPLDYVCEPETAGDVQTFKSLLCWLYQCDEGNVSEQALYKLFDGLVKDTMALYIIRNLPEYEQAEWD